MTRTTCAVLFLTLGATAVLAQSNISAERKEFMKTYGKHGYSTLNRMARDQMPYDQAKVDEALAHFIATAPKIPSLFPSGGFKGPEADSGYYANTKAFESQSDMKARAEKFAKDVADAKAKIKDVESFKATWPDINKNHCDSCHQEYRVRKSS